MAEKMNKTDIDTPFFSIVIPTYNRAIMLEKALNSVLNQTFNNWECIVVDDGSTDNTRVLMQELINSDSRFRYIYQANAERSAARNNGIKNANGKYICFLDSDDYYLSERLELLYNEILKQNEPIAMIYTGICFEKGSQIIRKTELLKDNYPNVFDFIFRAIIGVPQTCIARQILLKHQFNALFNIGEDMELWLRIVNEFPLIYFPDQFTVVALDHDDRSVNISRNNVFANVLEVFLYTRKQFNYPFSKGLGKYVKTECYFGIAKYYIYQKKRFMALKSLLLSIMYDMNNGRVKYKLNIAINLFINYQKVLNLIKQL